MSTKDWAWLFKQHKYLQIDEVRKEKFNINKMWYKMKEKKITNEIGKCFCLQSPYKHFIIISLEESIQNREKEIDIIKKAGEDIRKIKGIISHKEADAMIDVHRLTKEELAKVRNIIWNSELLNLNYDKRKTKNSVW